MNGFILLAVGVFLVLAAFGLWQKVWTCGKSLFTATTGVTVSTTLDAKLTGWLNSAESAKTQGLLRMAKVGFDSRGDTESAAAIGTLITKAATWDDVPVVTVTTTAP